jgi:hypothetical protein
MGERDYSAAGLDREAERLYAEAAAIRREAEVRAMLLEAQAATYRDAAQRLRDVGLPAPPAERSIPPVHDIDVRGRDANLKRAVGRTRRDSVAQQLLLEKGQTISGLARELHETRSRVSAWFAEDMALSRPIPRRIALQLREKYGIPPDLWTKISD